MSRHATRHVKQKSTPSGCSFSWLYREQFIYYLTHFCTGDGVDFVATEDEDLTILDDLIGNW